MSHFGLNVTFSVFFGGFFFFDAFILNHVFTNTSGNLSLEVFFFP